MTCGIEERQFKEFLGMGGEPTPAGSKFASWFALPGRCPGDSAGSHRAERHTGGKRHEKDVRLCGASLCRPLRNAEALGSFPGHTGLLLQASASVSTGGRAGVELQSGS